MAGIIIVVGIALCSRIAAIFALVGSTVGKLTRLALGANGVAIYNGLWGFNSFDAALAVGGVFFVLIECPVCRSDSRRVFSKPMLTSVPVALAAAIDHAEKTRHEPDIVASLPPAGARKRTPVLPLTPTLRRLPRP